MAVKILLLLISLFLNFYVPDTVNYSFIYLSTFIFMINAFFFLKDDIKSGYYISFNVIFTIAFFLCTYAYSLFVLGTPFEDLGMWTTKFINFDNVTHGITLSTVAYIIYTIVFSNFRSRSSNNINTYLQKEIYFNFRPLLIISSILLYINFYLYTTRYVYSSNVSVSPYISILFIIILCLSIITRTPTESTTFSGFIKIYKIETFICLFFTLLYLYIGDRGLPIKLMLILLYTYSRYFKKISIVKISLFFMIGAIIMYSLRITRHSEASIRNAGFSAAFNDVQSTINFEAPILVFSDLLGANFEMCTSLEYVKANGYYCPSQVILLPFMPIPLLPSLISESLYGNQVTAVMVSSALNDFMEDVGNYSAHFGNHVVTDLYIRWGVWGVIIGFCIFGFVVAKIENNQTNNLYYAVLYLILISTSIYLNRDSIINYIRYFSWTYFVIFFVRKFSYK